MTTARKRSTKVSIPLIDYTQLQRQSNAPSTRNPHMPRCSYHALPSFQPLSAYASLFIPYLTCHPNLPVHHDAHPLSTRRNDTNPPTHNTPQINPVRCETVFLRHVLEEEMLADSLHPSIRQTSPHNPARQDPISDSSPNPSDPIYLPILSRDY